ncbi:MAG: glycosyltransferase [Bacteroidota bacterium]|nr:glycosyltransferase [Bacteroidota bacterium]
MSRGGSERAHATLSLFLSQKGYQIYNIIFEDFLGYDYAGELFNLGKFDKMNLFQKVDRYIKLYKYVKKHKFDFIIDFRYRGTFYSEYFLVKCLFNNAKYIPSIRGARLYGYFTKNELVARNIFKKSHCIVTVSKAIENQVKQKYAYTNTKTIYNIVDLERIKFKSEAYKVPIDTPFVVGLGRMPSNNIKQQDVMIAAYAKSILPQKGIKLVLIGDGELRAKMEQKAQQLQLDDKVVFVGFEPNPYPYLKAAKLMLLTSKNEGFPNVILESFACQTPVVSYDCYTGPNEIINHKYNGLLVKDQDEEDLVKALNLMIEDPNLYATCKENTYTTAQMFSEENIGKQWLELLQ